MSAYFRNVKNLLFIFFLIAAVIAMYYQVFSAEYLYTDEANQLWYSRQGINYQTAVPQGRYITYHVFEWVFRYITTVNEVIYARLFSFFGWIVCLPVWYFIFNKLIIKNGLSRAIGMVLMVYLITMPPFIIYIGWSACMEMFIAYTSALMAGYFFYEGINYRGKSVKILYGKIVLSLIFGLISLFTYQNGYGCFFIPFFILFITSKKLSKTVYFGVIFSLITFAIYYLLFKYTLNTNGITDSNRSALATNPINKLLFLFSRPLATAFHFTYIFNEKNIIGFIVYFIFALAWICTYFITQKSTVLLQKITYLAGLLIFAVLIYLPSLIVKENFSSNRTLFALNIFIFFLVAETLFSLLKKSNLMYITTVVISFIFLINAWYNYNKQFVEPLKVEFAQLRKIIDTAYKPYILQINFICISENTFKEKFSITTSWDEFGVPSTSKIWVPEPLIKQLIFEKTGNRKMAEKIIVKSWLNMEAYVHSGEVVAKNCLLIDMQKALN